MSKTVELSYSLLASLSTMNSPVLEAFIGQSQIKYNILVWAFVLIKKNQAVFVLLLSWPISFI